MRRAGAHPRAGTQGFTLVEMLVTLTILGLASVMVLGAMRSAAVMVRQSGAKSAEASDIFRAQAILRSRIERMIALPVNRTVHATQVDGSATQLAFVAPAADREQPGGLRRYRLQLTPAGDLTLYSADLLSDRANTADAPFGWHAAQLLRDVAKVSIMSRDNGGWHASWSARPDLPTLVRIAVQRREGKQRWPILAIHPGALGSLACVTDDSGTQCEPLS